jgi:hypothetical protein
MQTIIITTTTRKHNILLSSIISFVVVTLLVTLTSNNNAYATTKESQIEMKNLTQWQWEQVKYNMNFTGIEIPDYVKNEYDIVINNDVDDNINNNDDDDYCYTSKCLLQKANDMLDEAEREYNWNQHKLNSYLSDMEKLERELRQLE